MKRILTLATLSLLASSCGPNSNDIKEKIEEVEQREHEMIVGSFTEPRAVTAEDMAVFDAAIAKYDPSTDSQARPIYVPTSVSTQVVAGVNYLFECDDNTPGADRPKIQILIYKPLPGEGEPLVKLQNPHF